MCVCIWVSDDTYKMFFCIPSASDSESSDNKSDDKKSDSDDKPVAAAVIANAASSEKINGAEASSELTVVQAVTEPEPVAAVKTQTDKKND